MQKMSLEFFRIGRKDFKIYLMRTTNYLGLLLRKE